MGTRCTINFISNEEILMERSVLFLYYQHDGYISYRGIELAEFLKDMKIVNGYGTEPINEANGIDCLALQYVAAHKKGIGNMYIAEKRQSEEYDYEVRWIKEKEEFEMIVYNNGIKIFQGTPKELIEFSKTK